MVIVMIDVKTLDDTTLNTVAGMYASAAFGTKCEPTELVGKKASRLRKKVLDYYSKEAFNELPEEIREIILKSEDQEFFTFARACSEESDRRATVKRCRFEKACEGLEDRVRSALSVLLEMPYCSHIEIDEGERTVKYRLDTGTLDSVVTFAECDVIHKPQKGSLMDRELYFDEDIGKYIFKGYYWTEDDLDEKQFEIRFSNVTVESEVLSLKNAFIYFDDPWDMLGQLCSSLLEKARFSLTYCNERETELLPLAKEVAALKSFAFPDEDEKYFKFMLLRREADRLGYEKISLMLAELEKIEAESPNYLSKAKSLCDLLNKHQHEPLWRGIFDRLMLSQEGYEELSSHCDRDSLVKKRAEAEKELRAHGYSGTYPDFEKEGEMRGVHLASSYGKTYFVGMKKRVKYLIHCCECFDGDSGYINYFCGTALSRKNERSEDIDIYSCLFNASGKRLFRQSNTPYDIKEENAKPALDVSIAVKRAECKPLSKEEKKHCFGDYVPGLGTFFGFLIVAGCLFAAAMTLGMAIIAIAFTCLLASWREVPDMLASMPWGQTFALAWILFGGSMGIVEMMIRRK